MKNQKSELKPYLCLVKLVVRIVLFYFCLSLFSSEIVSFALKYKDVSSLGIETEKEKSEESKDDKDSELEDFYLFHEFYTSIVAFNYHHKKNYVLESEKLISQVNKEISTPPPNC